MRIKIKKVNENAVTPTYNHSTDAGADLYATSVTYSDTYVEYDTGLIIEIPEGYAGFVFPRSSISNKKQSLCNSVGCIDSGYLGTIRLRFREDEAASKKDVYQIGDKIGQLIILPVPKLTFITVEELASTNRGSLGFGSSGS